MCANQWDYLNETGAVSSGEIIWRREKNPLTSTVLPRDSLRANYPRDCHPGDGTGFPDAVARRGHGGQIIAELVSPEISP